MICRILYIGVLEIWLQKLLKALTLMEKHFVKIRQLLVKKNKAIKMEINGMRLLIDGHIIIFVYYG